MTSYWAIFIRHYANKLTNGTVSGQKTRFRFLKLSCYFLIFCAISLSGCRSVSPLSLEKEKKPQRISFEDFSPIWQPFAQDEIPGLFYSCARISEPKLEIWAIKADLGESALQIVVNGSEGKNLSVSGVILSTKVSSFVRDRGLLAGINTVPFDLVSAAEGEERNCVGIVVSNGIVAALPVPEYDALVFYRNSGGQQTETPKAAILPQSEIRDLDNVENAVGGFRIILKEGKLPERLMSGNDTKPPRHPRSAAGLSDNGRILYLLVIDGRRPGSIGATEAETGLILKKLGAWQGLNFDGGGSTALALRFPDGGTRTVNKPIHSGIPGRERAVAACLGLGTVERGQIDR